MAFNYGCGDNGCMSRQEQVITSLSRLVAYGLEHSDKEEVEKKLRQAILILNSNVKEK